MYSIEKKDFGFKLTFAGTIDKSEMEKWVEESRQALESVSAPFGIMVDMRELSPLLEDAQAVMTGGQKLYKEKGMQRSVVILNSPTLTIQFKMLAQKSGIYEWERYIDASADSNWETKAIAWLKDSKDPDA